MYNRRLSNLELGKTVVKIEKILLAVVVLATMCLQSVAASTADDEVTARIKKVGSVCIQGDDCGLAAAPAVAVRTLRSQVWRTLAVAVAEPLLVVRHLVQQVVRE